MGSADSTRGGWDKTDLPTHQNTNGMSFYRMPIESEASAAAGLGPDSTVIRAVQEEGSHSTSPIEILGCCQGATWKDPFMKWSAVGVLTGHGDYTTTADRDSKSALMSHTMFPDAQRIYGRNPGEKIKHSDIL